MICGCARCLQGVVGRVALLLIDEIHLLAEESRGPTLEAVVARMKLLSQVRLIERRTTTAFTTLHQRHRVPRV